MNKKYDQTDRERDQSRRLEQGEAERKNTQQGSMPGRSQQQVGDVPRRHSVRDGDLGETLVDEA